MKNMQYFHAKKNIICFDKDELKKLFETPSRKILEEEIRKSGYSSEELMKDKTRMKEVVDRIKLLNDKEDIEIFAALFIYWKFYPKDPKICFLLKTGIDPRKNAMDTLEKLKDSIKENDITDFLFVNTVGECISIQLKAYRGNNEVKEFSKYLEDKLMGYGNDLGDTNLLIFMQSRGTIPENFFHDISDYVKAIKLKGTCHVLISYNENNQFDVINTIYPILGTTRIKHEHYT